MTEKGSATKNARSRAGVTTPCRSCCAASHSIVSPSCLSGACCSFRFWRVQKPGATEAPPSSSRTTVSSPAGRCSRAHSSQRPSLLPPPRRPPSLPACSASWHRLMDPSLAHSDTAVNHLLHRESSSKLKDGVRHFTFGASSTIGTRWCRWFLRTRGHPCRGQIALAEVN